GMAEVPEYVRHIMRKVPVSWDESRLVRGTPGKEVVIARRAGNIWYVAGVNGENSVKDWLLDLSFIQPMNGVIVGDQTPGNSDKKPTPNIPPFVFMKEPIIATTETPVRVQSNGGFLMIFGDNNL